MSNFGVQRLRVVTPYDAAFREARSAVGAADLMANAEEFQSVADAVADCTLVVGTTAIGQRQVQHAVWALPEAAQKIREHMATGPVALLFGSEKRGLSNEDLCHCHWLLRIPTRTEHRSMNLGQAVAICMYELARETVVAIQQPAVEAAANAAETGRLVAVLAEVLHASAYTTPDSAPLTEEKLHRMICRLHFSSTDAEVLLGMLRKIVWKLHHGNPPSHT